MVTSFSGRHGQPSIVPLRADKAATANTNNDRNHQAEQGEDVLVHFGGQIDNAFVSSYQSYEDEPCQTNSYTSSRRESTKRSSRSFPSRLSRQKSRRREVLGRHFKPGITVDTSFTRHKGSAPHLVYPESEPRSGGSVRRPGWFSGSRASTRNKGLGITKGTPQPTVTHRTLPSIDQNDLTAISLDPASKTWQDVSPWDRRIPIGLSVPTDSVSDFSSFHTIRQRSESDATLVTPNIVITPAAAMQSVWSPDTPFTESDYTPSVYGRTQLDNAIPPVPALPTAIMSSSKDTKPSTHTTDTPARTRSETLDSAGTAFEEDDDSKVKNRIMSTSTVFEEDETPLREKIVETTIAMDPALVPTPRRSQGWWNYITTPFVTTPNTAVWSPGERGNTSISHLPLVPANNSLPSYTTDIQHSSANAVTEKDPVTHDNRAASSSSTNTYTVANTFNINQNTASSKNLFSAATATSAAELAPSSAPSTRPPGAASTTTTQTSLSHDQRVLSPTSIMSASPVVGTASVGAVLVPREIQEKPRNININIELQDRRPVTVFPSGVAASSSRDVNSVAQNEGSSSLMPKASDLPQNLPVFAPPPSSTAKASRFSHDSRASSPDLKHPKKHRKVCTLPSVFNRRKQNANLNGKKRKKRGICFWGCCCCITLFILLAILIPVIVVITRRSQDQPRETAPSASEVSRWLNLTGFPPIPTGISTIAQPEAVDEESGCVAPTTLWSCALPKELQESVKPNKADQPNFRIEITYSNSTSKRSTKEASAKRGGNAAAASSFIRSHLLHLRALSSPSPLPPSDADRIFLGKTTDGNSQPFDGEETPLSITFSDPKTKLARLLSRGNGDDLTNITSVIPPPMLNSDGSAAPANLVPFPSAQPLRLFNRGKDTEYYGFYTYFDRSIFLKSINGTNRGGNPADTNGGSAKDAASLRCTFAETRFLVQIWTRSGTSKPLLQNSTSTATSAFSRPGTFPYPVTITLDRHGGNAAKKMLYCYTVESDGSIKNDATKRSFQFEDRSFGGNLVNGTQGRTSVTGPIDGGSGGCSCRWQNWLG